MIAREYLTSERRESRAEITIHIEDVNDNWPQFSKEQYYASIEENAALNTFVAQIQVQFRSQEIEIHSFILNECFTSHSHLSIYDTCIKKMLSLLGNARHWPFTFYRVLYMSCFFIPTCIALHVVRMVWWRLMGNTGISVDLTRNIMLSIL